MAPPCAWAIASAVGKPRPDPAPSAGAIVLADEEALEQVRLLVEWDARPLVRNRPGDGPCDLPNADGDRAARGAVLDCVGDEVDEGLLQATVVAEDLDRYARHVELDHLASLGRQGCERGDRLAGQRRSRRRGAAGGRSGPSGSGRSPGCRRRRAACDQRCARSYPAAYRSQPGRERLPGRAARQRRCGPRSAAYAARGRSWRGGRSAVVRARRGARRPPRRYPGYRSAPGGQGS